MSYMHIDNLYKDDTILSFRECYAMEKIHGTSAHVAFRTGVASMVDGHCDPAVSYFAGGEKHDRFKALFAEHEADMLRVFADMGVDQLIVYGEAYGGKCQGMKDTYGPDLRFVAFEVRTGDSWLNVPSAEQVARKLGFDFVHYKRIPATMEAIDEQRDASSVQAFKILGLTDKMREGVVLRPLTEFVMNNGKRVIAKHKRPEFCETQSMREADPAKRQMLDEASAIAAEWVTESRLKHVLDAMTAGTEDGTSLLGIEDTGKVIQAMMADVAREAAGEFADSKEARKAIGARTAMLFKRWIGSRFAKELALGAQYGTDD